MINIRGSSHNVPSRIMYDSWPWDSIIGGVTGLIGAGISAKASKYGADKQLQAVRETNSANLSLAREQNAWNRQMWEDTNEYNSTANQLARWTAAGLNPNSFAGQASPVAADTMQSADLANQQAPDIGGYYSQIGNAWQQGLNNAMSQMLAFKRFNVENKKADAEIQKLGSESTYIKSQVENVLPQTVKESQAKTDLYRKQIDSIEKSFAEIDARINNWNAQANLADTKSNESKLNQNFIKETWDKRLLSVDLANHLVRSEICKNYKQANLLAEELKGVVLENGLKGNEVMMLGITNWMKKVQMASETWQYLTDTEKMNKEAESASFLATLFSALSVGPFDAMKMTNQRRSWRYNSWQWLQDQNNSWFNPQPVTR